jgi:hypothetical protein
MPSKLDDYLNNASNDELQSIKEAGKDLDEASLNQPEQTDNPNAPTGTPSNTVNSTEVTPNIDTSGIKEGNNYQEQSDSTQAITNDVAEQAQGSGTDLVNNEVSVEQNSSSAKDSLAEYTQNPKEEAKDEQTQENTVEQNSNDDLER